MAWYSRFVVCWESFVPGGPIGAACWESFIPVRSAGFRVGRVLSRSSGETARSEGVRGLRGMYLRCRRAAARLESGARPAGPGRASRRRAERSSRRGRRAGGQASRHTEVWRLGASRTASGRAGLAPHGGLATGCLADGERAGRRPPAHRADADNRMCWA